VRYESFYFYPVFACNIMNEGWATYWHARLLRESDFLPEDLYLDAVKVHSNVVRPFAGEQQAALAINPYHLGFSMWERIVEQHGLERAKEIRREEDDFGFVRNHLDAELAEKLGLFVYEARADEGIKIAARDVNRVREAILAPKFNYGAPRIHVAEMRTDGTLMMVHDHQADGRGLDLERAQRVLEYVHRAWRRPVLLQTIDSRGSPHELRTGTR
jgi:stage V sporulation protein R